MSKRVRKRQRSIERTQKSIAVGCVSSSCHQMSVQVGVGPQVNKFEQVSSGGHRTSLAREVGAGGFRV